MLFRMQYFMLQSCYCTGTEFGHCEYGYIMLWCYTFKSPVEFTINYNVVVIM